MNGATPLLPLGTLLLCSALLALSAWEEEDGRRKRPWRKSPAGREVRRERLKGRTHDALELRLAGWSFVVAFLWWLATGAAAAGGSLPVTGMILRVAGGAVLGLALMLLGWALGRRWPCPLGLRWPIAPLHGLTMWLLWLWGLSPLSRRRAAAVTSAQSRAEASMGSARLGVAELASKSLEEIMVPRSQVAALDGELLAGEAGAQVVRAPHTLYPVHADSVDQLLGVVRILDLTAPEAAGRPVRELVRTVLVVPETMKGFALLRDLASAPTAAALVVDEFGGMAGLVTVEDLVEVLVGDLVGEHEIVRTRISPAGLGTYRVEGTCTVEEFNRFFGPLLPEGPYETLAGFFLECVGKIPQVGDRWDVPGAVLKILERTDRRILSLLVETPLSGASARASSHPVQSGPTRPE